MDIGAELGYAFIVLGILLFVIETFQPGFLLAVPATVLLVLGLLMVVAPSIVDGWMALPIILIVGCVTFYFTLQFYQSLAPPDSPPTGSMEVHIGKEGKIIRAVVAGTIEGKIKLGTQEFRANSNIDIPEGNRVRVTGADGIHLVVEAIE
ncbi:uncharacterized protein METZ01_LOCUS142214 [marine metagenome]|jgi:membrane protein implicated in regulation of membrane protease activity|uniref:NfeD-like C-terminal domain-containing protein n=1 Tax=marine metagenome TaxID=408172 RepID=A0A381ZJF0_9ZZZZ|nr:NfeD family protein [Candidatus Poseidoniia archaeon]MDP7589483.1 NfeD family protein [Candidatus Poseidoniia archaeon]|tara:strand:+ start:382 stop:831 length:450 start_codon:yes stop_codon:yes gene_type:complete